MKDHETRTGSTFMGVTVRWGLAAVVAVSAHVSLAYGIVMLAPVREAAAIQKAMTVELTPLVVSTAEAVETEPLEELASEIVPEMINEEEADRIDEVEPVETVEAEPELPESVDEQPESVAEEISPTPPVKVAEVVLPKKLKQASKPKPNAKPAVKPKPRKIIVAKKQEPALKKSAAPRKPEKSSARVSLSRKTKPRAIAPRAPAANPSRWYVAVQSAVARRRPRGTGQSGRVVIRFVVNSSGAVTSAAIARSSGNAALDAAALGMARGARVPAPPPGLGRSSFPFTIPVDFK